MQPLRTPQDVFDRMPSWLDGRAAAGISAVIQINLQGDDGGQWYIALKNGEATVNKGAAAGPDMTMSMTAGDWVDMNAGTLNRQMAFMTGKLKISGDMGLAQKMQTLFKRPS